MTKTSVDSQEIEVLDPQIEPPDREGRQYPRVTWLLPVRNGMPYLTATLESIESQTYTNWEILAWDNGSTDGTAGELRAWIPSRLPGTVVTGQPLGLGECLAEMVRRCATEFCARIDADDINVPDRLERQVAFLVAHPEIAAVGGQINRLDDEGLKHSRIARRPTDHQDIVTYMLRGPGMAHPTVLFRRSAVLEAGNYRNVGPVNVEDYDLWLRLAVHHRLANLPVSLLFYRIHKQSASAIAERDGLLRKASIDYFVKNAPALYGCSEREARLLLTRRHPCAILALYRIAGHLERHSGGKRTTRMRSATFLRVARRFVVRKDIVSRAVLTLLERTPPGGGRRSCLGKPPGDSFAG